jgi:pilus assembly protein CpaF
VNERIVTIEDAAELRLDHGHVVRLEARPPNAEGVGNITIRDLVRSALRMRPDRIVVGEVRGAEALDMLLALNTGHDGSLSTCHANNPADLVSRLETLVLLAGSGLDHATVRRQVRAAIDLVVHVERINGGGRRVSMIAELGGEGLGEEGHGAAAGTACGGSLRVLHDGVGSREPARRRWAHR